jgi:hypothetical protein
VQQVIGPLYARLLVEAASELGWGTVYLNLWPINGGVGETWRSVVEAMFKTAAALPILYTSADSGRWLTPSQAVFSTGATSRCESPPLPPPPSHIVLCRYGNAFLRCVSDPLTALSLWLHTLTCLQLLHELSSSSLGWRSAIKAL